MERTSRSCKKMKKMLRDTIVFDNSDIGKEFPLNILGEKMQAVYGGTRIVGSVDQIEVILHFTPVHKKKKGKKALTKTVKNV